eukprot:8884014-Ditylum_brightwellii.AAC.1
MILCGTLPRSKAMVPPACRAQVDMSDRQMPSGLGQDPQLLWRTAVREATGVDRGGRVVSKVIDSAGDSANQACHRASTLAVSNGPTFNAICVCGKGEGDHVDCSEAQAGNGGCLIAVVANSQADIAQAEWGLDGVCVAFAIFAGAEEEEEHDDEEVADCVVVLQGAPELGDDTSD